MMAQSAIVLIFQLNTSAHTSRRSSYLGLWCHSLSLTLKPRSRVSWARSAQGVLGCLAMTSLEQALGLGVLLGGLVLGGERLLGVIDDEGDGQVGGGLLARPGGFLGDLGHERPVLVSLDLEGDRLGQDQVVMGLPALFRLALEGLLEIWPSSRSWTLIRALSLKVAFSISGRAAWASSPGSMGKLRR